jgi:hypothetical protein
MHKLNSSRRYIKRRRRKKPKKREYRVVFVKKKNITNLESPMKKTLRLNTSVSFMRLIYARQPRLSSRR